VGFSRAQRSLIVCAVQLALSRNLAFCESCATAYRARDITIGQATSLVREGLRGTGTVKLPEFGLTYTGSPLGLTRWYDFMGTWKGMEGGSSMAGYWVVDKRTGEVWSGVICQQLQTARLRSLQQTIRQTIGLSDSDYSKIRIDGPFCDPRAAQCPEPSGNHKR